MGLPRRPRPRRDGTKRRARRRSSESGVALIISIFILAILLSLVVSLASSARVDLKASGNFTEGIQDDAIVDGAIAYATATLQNDVTAASTTSGSTSGTTTGSSTSGTTGTGELTLNDDWATLGDSGQTSFPLGGGAFQIQILDASSRVNLNTATREQLLALPGVTEEVADSIIDWRDTDDTPGSQGAESDTYQGYPRPYNAKNAPFDSVDELLMVKGITPQLLYGDPTQAPVTIDPTNPSPASSTDGSSQPALADYLTARSYEANVSTTGEPRVNLNQASAAQLQQLSGVSLTAAQAQAIVAKRNSGAYQSVADLLDVKVPVGTPGGNGGNNGRGGNPAPQQTQNLPQDIVKQMIDLCTVTNAKTLEGRIDVNTAPIEVIESIPNMTQDAANNIVSQRPFATVGDLLDDSIVPQSVFRQVVNQICTKSSVFLVRVLAEARPNGMPRAAEALVSVTANGGAHLLTKKIVGRWPGWRSWGWPDINTVPANQPSQQSSLPSSPASR